MQAGGGQCRQVGGQCRQGVDNHMYVMKLSVITAAVMCVFIVLGYLDLGV